MTSDASGISSATSAKALRSSPTFFSLLKREMAPMTGAPEGRGTSSCGSTPGGMTRMRARGMPTAARESAAASETVTTVARRESAAYRPRNGFCAIERPAMRCSIQTTRMPRSRAVAVASSLSVSERQTSMRASPRKRNQASVSARSGRKNGAVNGKIAAAAFETGSTPPQSGKALQLRAKNAPRSARDEETSVTACPAPSRASAVRSV